VLDFRKHFSDAFDRSIEELSRLLRVVRIQQNDPTIPLVGRDSLPGGVIYIVRYGEDGENILFQRHMGILMVNLGQTIPSDVRDDIDEREFHEIMIRYSSWIRGDPFFAAQDQYQRGNRARWIEIDFQGAVVAFYTAIEMFCNGLLGLCQWESGGTREELIGWLEKEGFDKRLRDRFHGFLGGNWDARSTSSPLQPLDDTARVRHRVVHAAYEPTQEEVDNAALAFSELSEFAKDRLIASKYSFPRTTMLLLGKSGLERKNAWSRRFERLAEVLVNEDDWLQTYTAWRQP